MIELEKINENVKFEPKEHKYILDGKPLISTTTVLGLYKNSFDPDGHILRAVAKRDGLTPEGVKKQWEDTKNEGLTRGKNFHRQAEHFIKTGQILDEDYKDVITQLKDIPFKGKLFSEVALHSKEHSIAGTCDLISLFDKNSTIIFDFKSNKKYSTKSKYNKFLLHPLEHLPECDHVIYSLQLGIYNKMLQEHGYKTKKGSTILYINPETRKIDKYEILDLSKEVDILLNYHSKMMAW